MYYSEAAALKDENGFELGTQFDFTNLNEYTINIKIKCNGNVISDNNTVIDLEPHEKLLLPLVMYVKT